MSDVWEHNAKYMQVRTKCYNGVSVLAGFYYSGSCFCWVDDADNEDCLKILGFFDIDFTNKTDQNLFKECAEIYLRLKGYIL